MAITQSAITLDNGTKVIEISVPFFAPTNFTSTSIIGSVAIGDTTITTATTGGTLADDSDFFYTFVAIKDSLTASKSEPLLARTGASANTNTITIEDIYFDENTSQYEVYRSDDDPWTPKRIQTAAVIPSPFTFTDTGLAQTNVLPPDEAYAITRLYWRKTGDDGWLFAAEDTASPLKFTVPFNLDTQSLDLKILSVDVHGNENPDSVSPTTTFVITGVAQNSLIGQDPGGTDWDLGMGDEFGGTDQFGIRHGTSVVFNVPTPNSANLLGGTITAGTASEVWGVDAPSTEFLDKTAGFNDATSANFSPFTFAAAEAINDYCAFGSIRKFSKLRFDSAGGTAGIGGVVAWEYWNGSSWTALSGVTDGTTGFTIAVVDGQDVTFTMPSDWDTTTISSGAELFFTRARVTTIYSTNPIYDQGFLTPAGVSQGGTVLFNEDKRLDTPERNMASHVTYRPTTNPLTGTDAGSDTTLDVANFTMRVAGNDVSITGSSTAITGLAFDTLYYIYYDDTTFAGGAVTFVQTTTKETGIDSKNRFFVGSIRTPKDGGSDTKGNNDGGSGAQFGFLLVRRPTTEDNTDFTTPEQARDNDTSSASTAAISDVESKVTVWSGLQQPSLFFHGKTMNLIIRSEVSDIAIDGTATLSYSLNNGVSFINIYDVNANRSLQEDTVSLSTDQTISDIQVRGQAEGVGAGDSAQLDMYDIRVEIEG